MNVAYGTTDIKCDRGETQTLPHAVPTVRFKHAVGSGLSMLLVHI